jgi:hypothetical protein
MVKSAGGILVTYQAEVDVEGFYPLDGEIRVLNLTVKRRTDRGSVLALQIEAIDGVDARNKALAQVEQVLDVIAGLIGALPRILGMPHVSRLPEIEEKPCGKIVTLYEEIVASARVDVNRGLPNEFFQKVEDVLTHLQKNKEGRLLGYGLKWLRRGMLREDGRDLVGAFIDYWTSLEALGHIIAPDNRGPTDKMRQTFTKLGLSEEDAEKLIELRGALFHSAEKEKEATEKTKELRSLVREALNKSKVNGSHLITA